MLHRVHTRRDQLARARHGRVHRHPGPGLVRHSDQPGDGIDPVGGLGVGPGSQVGEVSDHLDPPRPPANLRQRSTNQTGLGHRRAEQVREVTASRSQEPAGRLQDGHSRPGGELQDHPAPRSDVAHQGHPGLCPGDQGRTGRILI